jgi:hypothetical protein
MDEKVKGQIIYTTMYTMWLRGRRGGGGQHPVGLITKYVRIYLTYICGGSCARNPPSIFELVRG